MILVGEIIPTLMHRIPSEVWSLVRLGYISTGMGDLPGSPSVAPSPLFFMTPWRGREGAAVGFSCFPDSPRSVINTKEGWKRRRTEVVSATLYAASPVAAKLTNFSSSCSFSLFLFPPRFFFPFSSG
jgi:hypothetical protein